jgi:hypothetical protein
VVDAETGPDGRWDLAVPGEGPDLLIFARCRGEALGVVAAPAPADDGPLDLEITSVAPTHELTVRVECDGIPEWVRPQVRFMPLAIDAFDEGLLRWVTAPIGELSAGALARIQVDGRELRRYAQAGSWWLTAEYYEERSVNAPGLPSPLSLRAVAATTDDGTALPALNGGFQLEIAGPVAVTITLAA